MIQSLRIHGHNWAVEVTPGLREAEGIEGDCSGQTFTLRVNDAVPQMMRTTLWHEALHACLPGLPEKMIALIERETYQLLNDNPDFARYLTGAK